MTRAASGLVLTVALAALPHAVQAQQVIGGCQVLPANNIWNTPIQNRTPAR